MYSFCATPSFCHTLIGRAIARGLLCRDRPYAMSFEQAKEMKIVSWRIYPTHAHTPGIPISPCRRNQ